MKKIILLFAMISFVFTSCSKDDDNNDFKYDVNTLIGKWRVTEVQSDGKWIDVATTIGESVFKPTYATFNKNGTFYGEGFFGTGSGTYKTENSTIICYIDGDEYLRYDVISLSDNKCELKMYDNEGSAAVRCTKQIEEDK